MLRLVTLLNLVKCIFNGTNGQAIVEMILSHLNFSSSSIRILKGFRLFVFVAFHGEGFARTCLSVSEYGGVEALNYLSNQPTDLELIENVCLRILIIQDFIEGIILFRIAIRLKDTNLVCICISNQKIFLMACFYLIRQ